VHPLILCCDWQLCYADRVNMSVAAVRMDIEMRWGVSAKARVLGSLFAGYCLSQVFGAVLARKFGGKRVLGIATLLWSSLIMLTPHVAARSVGLLILCRFTLGVLEGVAFPVIFHLLAAFVPDTERTRAVTFIHAGLHSGTTLALLATPAIIEGFGWTLVFVGFGSLGFVWFAFWHLYAPDDAQAHKRSGSIVCCHLARCLF
jgi:ACS family sodium-dependent inorganic phosphate cotransporter